ncbi:MAG: radical SAM protein [Thermodesulfobacteriota bacterium]
MPILRRLAGLAAAVLTKPLKVRTMPIHLQMEITTFCNLACVMCPRAALVKKPAHMAVDSISALIEAIQPATVNLSGLGEPLLHPRIRDIVIFCKAAGSAVNFPTSLAVPTSAMADLVESGIDQVKISIDAATPETWRRIRGEDRFTQVIDNIREINRLKKETGANRPALRFNVAVLSHNIDEMADIVTLAADLDVQAVYFQWLLYDGVPDKQDELNAGLTESRLRKTIDRVKQASRRTGVATNIGAWQRDMAVLASRMAGQSAKPDRTCYFPWLSTYVDVAGNVMPCPKFANTREAVMGNVFETDFSVIWNSGSYQTFRHSWKQQPLYDTCRHCVPLTLFDAGTLFRRLTGRL